MAKIVTLPLNGLDCANCANTIERALHKNGLTECTVSFGTNQILLPEDQVEQAQAIINTIEPDVTIARPAPVVVPEGQRVHSEAEDHDHGEAGHDHDHGHDHGGGEMGRGRLVEVIFAAVLFLVGFAFNQRLHNTPYAVAEYAVLLTAYALVGRRVLWAAIRNATRGQLFDENFLMAIATIGAFFIHELPEAVGVMLFYSVGEYFQDVAVSRSRRSIRALMEVRPDYANVKRNGVVVRVSPENVAIDEEIIVKPGERIPLDGEIVEGSSLVDTSALTGESVPRQVRIGDTVLSGSVNIRGVIGIRVNREFGESSIAKIMQLVEQAAARKATTERVITSFSRYYTPAVVLIALLIALVPPLVMPGALFSEWLRRALVLLVISCPCALVISVPLSYFGGIGGASRRGILVKGANYLDSLAKVDTVVWDKTGTLTQGVFRVTEVTPAGAFTRDELLDLAAHAEVHSSHPIATSIMEAYGKPVDAAAVSEYEEVAGHGVRVRDGGRLVAVGNARLMEREGVSMPAENDPAGTVVYIAVDGSYAGRIVIADEPKPEAAVAIRTLRTLGVRRHVMLTGDDRRVAERVGKDLGLDEVRANLLPEDKVAEIERVDQQRTDRQKGALAFVGDGINDAPVLTRADVGIAMGGLGSDAAIEAADVVIMDDNPAKLAVAVGVARKTRQIVYQNILFALAVKVIVMALGATGAANMWEAVFADVGVSLLAILNATRVLRYNASK
jgi:Cd2+/Zn2+-exporting ATPase